MSEPSNTLPTLASRPLLQKEHFGNNILYFKLQEMIPMGYGWSKSWMMAFDDAYCILYSCTIYPFFVLYNFWYAGKSGAWTHRGDHVIPWNIYVAKLPGAQRMPLCVSMNGRNLDDSIQRYRLGKYRHATVCIYFKNSISSTEVAYRHSWLLILSTLERSCVLVAITPRSFPFLFFAK